MNRRPKVATTLMGNIQLRRPYYHCAHCRHGSFLWDQTLGLDPRGFTPAAQELVTLAGTQISFPKASQRTLHKMSGLRLSESTVQRITEGVGARLRKLFDEGTRLGETVSWDWQRDAEGRTCAYVSIDATGVRQQGPNGRKAEGRMAYVAKLYSPPMLDSKRPNKDQVRYFSGFYDLDALGLRVRRQAGQIGWDDAQQQVALSDGGVGLEEFFRKNFPRAECILDFWHAKEHLVELSQAWFGTAEAERKAWLDEQCHRLKHEGGQAVLEQLEAFDLSACGAGVREVHREHTQYFRNQVHRMDYPRYQKNGWQIGSGPVEAACKTVVGERLKCSGMRWGKDGADSLCHLRALFLSESSLWEAFWRDHPNLRAWFTY